MGNEVLKYSDESWVLSFEFFNQKPETQHSKLILRG